jgi:glycosyltransferase involved in cell wall biosynthesis
MERLLEIHARIGDRDAFEYFAAYLVERPNSVIARLEDLGVACTQLGSGRGLDLRWALDLRAFVRRHSIDVVHIHSPMVAAVARPVLRSMCDRPAIMYTEHNSWECYSPATRLANAASFPLDDAQFAVSSAAARSAIGPLKRGVEVLRHGIDIESVAKRASQRELKRSELGIGPDTIVVITVANLRREKAYDVLLDGAARATAKRSDLVFLSVGQGPLGPVMQERAIALGLGEKFRFLGYRDDVPDLLAAADIFCLASRSEGLPLALMEASAMGLPAVVTLVGGLPEAVEDGQSGFCVMPDDARALADAIVAVAADDRRRTDMGRRALELACRFDSRRWVRRVETVYAELSP